MHDSTIGLVYAAAVGGMFGMVGITVSVVLERIKKPDSQRPHGNGYMTSTQFFALRKMANDAFKLNAKLLNEVDMLLGELYNLGARFKKTAKALKQCIEMHDRCRYTGSMFADDYVLHITQPLESYIKSIEDMKPKALIKEWQKKREMKYK